MKCNTMYVDTEVVKNLDGEPTYDKFAVASTLFDMSFKGSECHLLKAEILGDCKACNLEPICNNIDGLVEKYVDATTTTISNFTFGAAASTKAIQ